LSAESRVVTLSLHDVPPSLNRVAGTHWRVFHREKAAWQRNIEMALLVAAVPRGLARVHATAHLRFPQRRRRDEGNFRWLLEKALGDALTNGRFLADDTAAQFTTGAVTFDPEPGPKHTAIRLTIE
jgi:hypothetical protein